MTAGPEVFPGYHGILNDSEPKAMLVCDRCGAVVFDNEQHDTWHLTLRTVVEQLARAGLDQRRAPYIEAPMTGAGRLVDVAVVMQEESWRRVIDILKETDTAWSVSLALRIQRQLRSAPY